MTTLCFPEVLQKTLFLLNCAKGSPESCEHRSIVSLKLLRVHSNIALLLYLLHILCLIHAINYIISKIYQLYLSFFATNPCHMFLPRNFYLLTHNLIVFCTNGLFNTLVAMVIERCVAAALVDIYEKRFRTLGILLTAIALLLSFIETVNGYKYVAGDYLMTNSLIHPGTKSTLVSTGFAVLWLISCLLLLTTILLYCFNTRRKKRSTLTSRYQSLENVATSGLLCVILIIYLVIFSTYTCSMMFLRLTKSEDPMLDAYKEVAYLIPLGTLLIPLGALIFMRKSKQRRRYGINDIVNIQTHGLKGWDNYAAMLDKQWNK
ncbi:unnamed protein product [Cylicocyclus nassatus]|uniref:Uncharacterized protein n=1 Tax=Cylicocyclus nassatus TaxID=53992 RepID=A0AA36H411_CYLNA|nr:unnamed protein product [Cylicocyclus nassatus]